MSDVGDRHHGHERRLEREELRRFTPDASMYLDTPHLIVPPLGGGGGILGWDDTAAVVIGAGDMPVQAAGIWTLPVGSWTAKLALIGTGSYPLERVRLLADEDVAAFVPTYQFVADLPVASDAQTPDVTAGDVGGTVETGPLVSTGTLQFWVSTTASVAATTRLALGRLA